MNVIDFHDIVLSIGANTTDRAHCRSIIAWDTVT